MAAVSLLLIAARPAGAALPGDCNDDGQVTVNELITGVNVALGNAAPTACPPLDANGDGSVGINELVLAVSAALGLLPSTATPTPSPTAPAATATAIAAATFTPSPPDASATPTAPEPPTATPDASPTASAPASPTPTTVATPTAVASATATASSTATVPTRTPTIASSCAATPLPGDAEVSVSGSTAGAADTAGGASCGFGGGQGAPNAVYEYVAPASGTYDIATRDATFPVYLFVRENSCGESETELACVDSPADAALAVGLAGGQRVAIVVDGSTPTGGAFTLSVTRRQADLVVHSVTAPPAATAAGAIEVMAEVENAGTAAAGPFSVEFFWGRDATLADRLGTAVTRCAIAGLAPGARTTCQPLNPLGVPLVAADGYVVGVRVDDTAAVDERREDNNTAAAACAMAVAGAELQQELYRARDGTGYQLVSVVPSALPSAADRFRITAVTGVDAGAASCATLETQPGSLARAVAGAASAPSLDGVTRTAVLRPNDASQVVFEPAAGGRLLLGNGATATAVCDRPERCGGTGAVLTPASAAGGGLPGACVATNVPGALCNGVQVGAAIAFPDQAGESCPSAGVTAETEICAIEPTDGFVLRPGEAVVFVYTPGRGPLESAVAGFGISGAEGAAGCAANRVVAPRTALARSEPQPLLSLAGVLSEVDPQELQRPALSPDGRHLYAASGFIGALAVFRVIDDGGVELIELQRQSEHGVDGLAGGAAAAVSPDGAHVYTVAAGAVAVFRRDPDSGRLTFVQVRRNGVGGVQGIAFPHTALLSSDGRYLYAVGAAAIAVFRRDPTTGALTFVEVQRDGVGGVEALVGVAGAALAPDGAHLYAPNRDESAVLVFARDPDSGRLTFVAAQRDGMPDVSGLSAAQAIAISPDGAHVYVAPLAPAGATVTALRRDPGSGLLATVGTYDAVGEPGLTFTALFSVAASPDGTSVYVGGEAVDDQHPSATGAIAVFRRQPADGALLGLQTDLSSAHFFERLTSVLVAPDGENVFATSGPAAVVSTTQPPAGSLLTFDRLAPDGVLRQRADYRGAPPIGEGLLLSRDGSAAYRIAFDGLNPEMRRLRRDTGTGGLEPAERLSSPGISSMSRLAATSVGDAAVYVLDEGELRVFGGLDGLGLRQTVPIADPDPQAFGSLTALVASPDGHHVYVGGCDILGGFVTLLSRAPDETLAIIDQVRASDSGFAGLGCVGALAVSADGRHLYVTTTGAKLMVLARDADSGALSVAGVHNDLSGGPHLALSPDQRHLYVTASFVVGRYLVDAATGAVDFAGIEPDVSLGTGPATLVVSPDGAHAYLSDPSFDAFVAAYDRDPGTGALVPQQTLPRVAHAAVSPDGAFVYATRVSDRAILILAVAD